MHYSSKIKKYYDGMNVYEHLLEDEKAIHIPFALSFTVTITTINSQLKTFLMDLKNKDCQEIPDIDFDLMTDIRNIMSTKLKSDMAVLDEKTIREHLEDIFGPHMDKRPSEVHDFIYNQTLQMTDMLKQAREGLEHADPALFEKYVRRHLEQGNWDDVRDRYHKWKHKQSDLSMETLLEKQEQELRKYIDWGVMRFAQMPSRSKMAKVDYDYHRDLQDCKFEDSEEYRIAYTQFMQFASRHDGMLNIDLRKYGKYIFDYFYQFSESQKVAVFELCVVLDLIHEDMMNLMKIELPAPLATPEAMVLWQKAIAAGWVDERYQPKLSLTKSAVLASEMANRLGINDKWKYFEILWKRKNMRSDYNTALSQKQILKFQDEIRTVFCSI